MSRSAAGVDYRPFQVFQKLVSFKIEENFIISEEVMCFRHHWSKKEKHM